MYLQLPKLTVKVEILTTRSNTIHVKTETSRKCPTDPPNAGHIANNDWLVGLFSVMSLENHMKGMLLGKKQ